MKYKYDKFNNNSFESHRIAFDLVSPNSKVLDIGCATGYFAKELQKINCETWGIDGDLNAINKAEKYCKKTICLNIDQVVSLPVPKKYFDFILLLDVAEHLRNPENLLEVIKPYLKNDGRVIISVPNIAHASIRWMILRGEFRYENTGILDKTHIRFFTKNTFTDLLKKSGLRIKKLLQTNGMCKVPFLYKITDRLPRSWQYKIACWWPTLFSFQFVALTKVNRV